MPTDAVRTNASLELKTEFARRLADRMLQMDMNQSELARKVKMSKDAISTYTRGRSLPSQSSLLKLAKALGTEPGTLLPRRYDTSPQSGPAKILLLNENEMEISIQKVVSIEAGMKIIDILRREEAAQTAKAVKPTGAPEGKGARAK
jgi:transcriptional regulator with XRE-family HTH domain